MPVGAWPIRSVPRSAIGSAYSWIANARVMPTAASAVTVSGAGAQLGEGGCLRAYRGGGGQFLAGQ